MKNIPMVRRQYKTQARPMVAYDLETTRIKKGTPKPVYLTAFGNDFRVSIRVESFKHLGEVLEQRFLWPQYSRMRFVAWNGNNFDAYLIALALLELDRYLLRPYLARNGKLRGLKVCSQDKHQGRAVWWEFLDGISMTGIEASLEKFLKVFAPEYPKLHNINFDRESFNPRNPDHVKYAERDSEGLFYGMMNAEGIMLEKFGHHFKPTIGNLGIKLFQENMPPKVTVWPLRDKERAIVRDHVYRGGFCYLHKRYSGPVWKYDLNQAYAAAMRDAKLPCGALRRVNRRGKHGEPEIWCVNARNVKNTIPLYLRDEKMLGIFPVKEITDAWLTSIELDQLEREGWKIERLAGWRWSQSFTMSDFVGRLETLRINAPGGVNGALGLMCKYVGNNCYGKFLEQETDQEIVIAKDAPPGYYEYDPEQDFAGVLWARKTEARARAYHHPQIAAFITAHVRMLVRAAALRDPGAFIYADTDCVVFSRAVKLPCDPVRYGKWKIEVAGDRYIFVGKKIYAAADGSLMKAKGLRRDAEKVGGGKITVADYSRWYAGQSPKVTQLQRKSFMAVVGKGGQMFDNIEKVGSIAIPAKRA